MFSSIYSILREQNEELLSYPFLLHYLYVDSLAGRPDTGQIQSYYIFQKKTLESVSGNALCQR